MIKYKVLIGILLVLIAGPTFGAQTLDDLVATALQNNPELQAAEARWRMAERRIIPSSALDDPLLSVAFMNYPINSFAADETPMTGNELRLTQKFPFPGKLGTKGEVAQQRALWFLAVYDDAKLKLAQQVKDVSYRLFFKDKAIAITENNLTVLDDFIRLTETRYQVGQGLQQDVLKAQVERSKLMDKLFSLRQERESAAARLNQLLNRSTQTPVEMEMELSLTDVNLSLDDLQQRSEQERPMYEAFRTLTRQYQSKRKLAKLNYYPDMTFWAGYRFRDDSGMDPVEGQDFASAGIMFNLPIYQNKRNEAVIEAEEGLRMARNQYDGFRAKVQSSIHDAFARMNKNKERALLYRTGIIPQANQAFRSSMSAYQVGKVEFLTLLDALLKLYRYEIDYYRVLVDHERDVARLEADSAVHLTGAKINFEQDEKPSR